MAICVSLLLIRVIFQLFNTYKYNMVNKKIWMNPIISILNC